MKQQQIVNHTYYISNFHRIQVIRQSESTIFIKLLLSKISNRWSYSRLIIFFTLQRNYISRVRSDLMLSQFLSTEHTLHKIKSNQLCIGYDVSSYCTHLKITSITARYYVCTTILQIRRSDSSQRFAAMPDEQISSLLRAIVFFLDFYAHLNHPCIVS